MDVNIVIGERAVDALPRSRADEQLDQDTEHSQSLGRSSCSLPRAGRFTVAGAALSTNKSLLPWAAAGRARCSLASVGDRTKRRHRRVDTAGRHPRGVGVVPGGHGRVVPGVHDLGVHRTRGSARPTRTQPDGTPTPSHATRTAHATATRTLAEHHRRHTDNQTKAARVPPTPQWTAARAALQQRWTT